MNRIAHRWPRPTATGLLGLLLALTLGTSMWKPPAAIAQAPAPAKEEKEEKKKPDADKPDAPKSNEPKKADAGK